MKRVRLAIVDDALFIREGLRRSLSMDPRIDVVGTAPTGEALLASLDAWRPDVITLDINMPGMGGLATLDRLMEMGGAAVIVLSTQTGEGAPITLEALSRGAADFVDKERLSLTDFGALRGVMVERILAVAGWTDPPPGRKTVLPPPPARLPGDRLELLLIGASTGGPRAIETVLRGLEDECPVPVLIVQHMPVGFTAAFADRLDRELPFPVLEASDHLPLQPGHVVIGPAGVDLAVERHGGRLAARLVHDAPGPFRPSVDSMLCSAAAVVRGAAAAVILTGMGTDGARGMKQLYQAGALTIAQDQESCVVFGMPCAAIAQDAVRVVLPLDHIGPHLRDVFATSQEGAGAASPSGGKNV